MDSKKVKYAQKEGKHNQKLSGEKNLILYRKGRGRYGDMVFRSEYRPL
jgi:hypothetical protein